MVTVAAAVVLAEFVVVAVVVVAVEVPLVAVNALVVLLLGRLLPLPLPLGRSRRSSADFDRRRDARMAARNESDTSADSDVGFTGCWPSD